MNNQINNQTQKKPEGTVTIENKHTQNLKGKKKDDDDFVDYEEVK